MTDSASEPRSIIRSTGVGLLVYGLSLGGFLLIVSSSPLQFLDAVLFSLAGLGLWLGTSRIAALLAVGLSSVITATTVYGALTVPFVHASNVLIALVLLFWSTRGLVGSLKLHGLGSFPRWSLPGSR